MRKSIYIAAVSIIFMLLGTSCDSSSEEDFMYELFPAVNNVDFQKTIDSVKERYTFNTYDKVVEWEEIEYEQSNMENNRIIRYSLNSGSDYQAGYLYRDGEKIGEITTEGLYKVYFTPIGKKRSLLYDFSIIMDRACGVYWKIPNSNGVLWDFGKTKDGYYNCITNLRPLNGNPYKDIDRYDQMCFARDISNNIAVAGIGYINDGILHSYEPVKSGYKRHLVQFAIKDNPSKEQWSVLFSKTTSNSFLFLNYVPSDIWKEEFKYELELWMVL